MDYLLEDNRSGGSSRTNSPGGSDCEDNPLEGKSRRHKALVKRRVNLPEFNDYIDLDYWTR